MIVGYLGVETVIILMSLKFAREMDLAQVVLAAVILIHWNLRVWNVSQESLMQKWRGKTLVNSIISLVFVTLSIIVWVRFDEDLLIGTF